MTFIRLLRAEFTRLTSSLTPLITIIGLALIPLLYSGVYLYANWDPYDNLDSVDAALVNLDEGADFDGVQRTIGEDVTDELLEDGTFGWHSVSSRTEAEAGVESGEYQFALIIPTDFSAALASPSSFSFAEQAILEVTVNEANNYLLTNIVNSLTTRVHDTVAAQVGQETADAMLTGYGQIHQQLTEAADGAGQLRDGAVALQDGMTELHQGSTELTDGAVALDEGTHQLRSGIAELNAGSGDLAAGAAELSDGTGALHSGLGELVQGGESVEGAAEALNSGAQELSTGMESLSAGADAVAEGSHQLAAATDEAAEVISHFESNAADRVPTAVEALIDAGLIDQSQVQDAEAALGAIADDSAHLQRAAAARQELATAHESINELTSGAQQVADGAAELSAGSSTLADGTAQLVASAPDLVQGLQDAESAAAQLNDGAGQLKDGADQLHAGTGTLASGAEELTAGSAELSSGAATLRDGLGEARSGTGELKDGARELAEGLGAGAQEVPNPDGKAQEQIARVMGNPVAVHQSAQTEAGSYGAGMAPFFLALSLWIGALVLLQVLRPFSARALASNAPSVSIAAGSWLSFAGIALVQALLLYAAVVLGLGLTPAHPWLALALLIASSVAFTALIQGAVALLGNPGKMLMLVLLVLQLVASGGTFPYQALPPVLQGLHPLLPMSYVVDGLRHVIYGGRLDALQTALLALLVTAIIGFSVQVLAVHKKKMWSLRRLQPPIQEAA